MPARQDTFRLIPTTLVNTTGPRPPMTSKAAKKAYREANRLPRISRAEQRRREAAEIARQKKEYEKERAAAKAKAARERKLQKEAEERAKRKELGLPEPSRFVRPSQPTIKTFVKTRSGRKRSLEEVESAEEGRAGNGTKDHDEPEPKPQAINPAKRTAVERDDEDDEFGDFPSLSQADLPTWFEEQDENSRTVSMQSSASKTSYTISQPQFPQCKAAEYVPAVNQVEIDTKMVKSQSFAEASLARKTVPPVPQLQSQTSILAAPSNLSKGMTETTAVSTTVPELYVPKTSNPVALKKRLDKPMNEISGIMPPLAIPMTVNRLRSRMPLNEVSRNTVSAPRPSKASPFRSTNKARAMLEQKLGQENSSMPPPSTLAFLEAHLDDFFPSPSQQVRELLEDVDDMPSNTQIAREIDLEESNISVRISHMPSPVPQSHEGLHCLSSQDLEISSQDLRDIDTPSKAVPQSSLLRNMTSHAARVSAEAAAPGPPLAAPKSKARFFEEKEEDLLHAALHESLVMSRQTTQCCYSPRRSQRVLQRSQSARTDHGCDDYGSDGSDLDPDLLALLDDA